MRTHPGFVSGSSDLCPGRGQIVELIEKSLFVCIKQNIKDQRFSGPVDRIDLVNVWPG